MTTQNQLSLPFQSPPREWAYLAVGVGLLRRDPTRPGLWRWQVLDETSTPRWKGQAVTLERAQRHPFTLHRVAIDSDLPWYMPPQGMEPVQQAPGSQNDDQDWDTFTHAFGGAQ